MTQTVHNIVHCSRWVVCAACTLGTQACVVARACRRTPRVVRACPGRNTRSLLSRSRLQELCLDAQRVNPVMTLIPCYDTRPPCHVQDWLGHQQWVATPKGHNPSQHQNNVGHQTDRLGHDTNNCVARLRCLTHVVTLKTVSRQTSAHHAAFVS